MSRHKIAQQNRQRLMNASALTSANDWLSVDQPFVSPLHHIEAELHWVRLRAQRIHVDNLLATGGPQRNDWQRRDEEEPPTPQLRRSLHRQECKLRQAIDARRALHRKQGQPLPLDQLQDLYHLDAFETTAVLLATASGFSVEFDDLWELVSPNGHGSLSVENLFNFCELPWIERVGRRACFGPQAPLVANQLGRLDMNRRWATPEQLLTTSLSCTPQTFAFLAGKPDLDAEFAEFSSLEPPRARLDCVVLPPDDRRRILSVVDNHAQYLKTRQSWGLDDVITYGKGVLMLFYGKPGTGKTLTAHGVANHLGKRVLNVDIPTFVESKQADQFLPGLFREARLHNALLFFDECEVLFGSRRAGNGLMTLLLTELERFEGVAILATNLPQALDEALDRRILVKVEFADPDKQARKEIWQRHLPPQTPLDADVDLDALADRFELSGGYIKNAVLMAVADAVHANLTPPRLTMAMLERAARDQCKRIDSDSLAHPLVHPKVRLAEVVLPPDLQETVAEIVAAARNRRLILERWGIGTHLTAGKGVAALLSGPPGTGKTLCAEAIANELCRPLLVAQLPALLSKWVGGTENRLKDLFDTAKSEGAVLLVDECDALVTDRGDAQQRHDVSMVTVLLGLLERHDGVVLLATNRPQVLDKALARRLGWHLQFAMPDAGLRARIWQGLLPPTVPGANRIDTLRLGRKFAMSGGHIRNAVFKAALRAANGDGELSQTLLDRAARDELHAAGGVEEAAVVREVAEG